MSEKKIPHVHTNEIKAWADGAKIQYRLKGSSHPWDDCASTPGWSTGCDYRVKPEPKPDVVAYSMVHNAYPKVDHVYVSNAYRARSEVFPPKANLKLTFDGETGKLKSAEAL